jgi:hypothetical protein
MRPPLHIPCSGFEVHAHFRGSLSQGLLKLMLVRLQKQSPNNQAIQKKIDHYYLRHSNSDFILASFCASICQPFSKLRGRNLSTFQRKIFV